MQWSLTAMELVLLVGLVSMEMVVQQLFQDIFPNYQKFALHEAIDNRDGQILDIDFIL